MDTIPETRPTWTNRHGTRPTTDAVAMPKSTRRQQRRVRMRGLLGHCLLLLSPFFNDACSALAQTTPPAQVWSEFGRPTAVAATRSVSTSPTVPMPSGGQIDAAPVADKPYAIRWSGVEPGALPIRREPVGPILGAPTGVGIEPPSFGQEKVEQWRQNAMLGDRTPFGTQQGNGQVATGQSANSLLNSNASPSARPLSPLETDVLARYGTSERLPVSGPVQAPTGSQFDAALGQETRRETRVASRFPNEPPQSIALQDYAQNSAVNALQNPPTSAPQSVSDGTPISSAATQATAKLEMLEGARVVAQVGDQVILAGDLYGQINQVLQQYVDRLPPEQLNQQRWKFVEQLLPKYVEAKLVYVDFLRKIPVEKVPEVMDSIFRQFDELQLPRMVESANLPSAAELDAVFRTFGSSLDAQRRAFAEQLLAMQWRKRNIGETKEVTHEEMLAYYHEHADDYRLAAMSRWEHLMTGKSEFPSTADAMQALAEMGNEVVHGASLPAVARKKSQGPRAGDGGQFDWTTLGSLASPVLNDAIANLPLNTLSEILEDDKGFHIVRVLERRAEGMVPFEEAQIGIRKKIVEEREAAAEEAYMQKLRDSTYVWTAFQDSPASGTRTR